MNKLLGVAGVLSVAAAGKSAFWDHDSWIVWLPNLTIALLILAILVDKR